MRVCLVFFFVFFFFLNCCSLSFFRFLFPRSLIYPYTFFSYADGAGDTDSKLLGDIDATLKLGRVDGDVDPDGA